MSIEIDLLANRPHLVGALARGYDEEWPQWYGPAGRGDARADLTERSQADSIPLGLVAVEDGEALGALALTATSGPGRKEWTPWFGGFWVRPDRRRQGIGAALVRRAVTEAGRLGFARVYAATAGAGSLFVREGWDRLETVRHEGERIEVFARTTRP